MPDAFLPHTWVRQMKGMLAEHCKRRRRKKDPYHLRKDKTIYFKKRIESEDTQKFLYTTRYQTQSSTLWDYTTSVYAEVNDS